jgi:hypothetical protein
VPATSFQSRLESARSLRRARESHRATRTSAASRIRGLAGGAEVTRVLFDSCYSNYAQVNARQLADLLGV